ncbi:HAD family hydrolase [Fictibacillus iocasae]|uniref:HAD family hydrolase n=1 Tax=Fictibacillus iocasae TaxID=2715437 RepID=A0ABW2NVD7_9BACL
MIKALIFDFDGTILDTESQEYQALKEIFEEHGCELPLDVWGKCIGTANVFDPYEYLEEQYKQPIKHDELREKRMKRSHSLILEQEALPGVVAYLEAAKELGLKIGLASSSTRSWVTGHLERIGLLHYFETIKTADDVDEVKPNPALYLEAAQALGVKSEEAVAFEDSVNGAKAAKAAGMFCVAIPNPVTRHMNFDGTDLVLESLAQKELSDLLHSLNN